MAGLGRRCRSGALRGNGALPKLCVAAAENLQVLVRHGLRECQLQDLRVEAVGVGEKRVGRQGAQGFRGEIRWERGRGKGREGKGLEALLQQKLLLLDDLELLLHGSHQLYSPCLRRRLGHRRKKNGTRVQDRI